MKKLTVIFAAIIILAQQPLCAESSAHIDARIAAFNPSQKLMREIYGNWLVDYQVEAGWIIYPTYELWGNASYVNAGGTTQSLGSKTRLTNTNISCGGKYLFCLNKCIQLYLGAGINGAFVHVYNDSSFVKRNVNKCGVGGVFKAGIYYRPYKNLFCEIFTDYLYQKINFQNNVQIGGVKIGAGVGMTF